MRRGLAMALVTLLAAHPVGTVDLVKVAMLPKGHIDYYQLPVGDLDHDGRRDLVFSQSLSPFSANIWEHWGSNSYQPVKITEECVPIVEGDPDRDALSDLLCQWGGRAFILESQTPNTFPSRTVWEEPVGGFPGIRGYFEDTDQDGRQEMWIVPNDPDQIEVWENRGDDTYVLVALLTDPLMQPETLAFGDFDGDGNTETIVGGPSYNDLFVWENTGSDAWDVVWSYEFPIQWTTGIVAAADDLDMDGKPEFLVGTKVSDTFEHAVSVFEATGDNAYAPVWQLQGPGSFTLTHISVGDIDGDAVEEFAVTIPGAIHLYEAFGNDDFRPIGEVHYTGETFSGIFTIALADLNGDGTDEVIFNGAFDRDGTPTRIFIDEMADLQPPVLIPAFFPTQYAVPSGQPLTVHAELFNRTDQTQTVDVWAEAYRGSGQGGPQGPLLRRQLLLSQAPLPPGRTVSHRFSVTVPCPPGPCTLQLKVGTFPAQVTDTRWFTVVVTPADS